LKEKLKTLKEAQPPSEKKDELIKHLMTRLSQGEEAIAAAEEVISHERANRKRLFQEIKKSNQELRELVEKEKKQLSEKVMVELEKHLQQAIKEKMQADEAMNKAKKELEVKAKECEEMGANNKKLLEDLKLA
jgi:hypothetical protein